MHPITTQLVNPSASGQRNLATNEQQTPLPAEVAAQTDHANKDSFQHFFDAETGTSSQTKVDISEDSTEEVTVEKDAEHQDEKARQIRSEVEVPETIGVTQTDDQKRKAPIAGVDAKGDILDVSKPQEFPINKADQDAPTVSGISKATDTVSIHTLEVRSLQRLGVEPSDGSKPQIQLGIAAASPVATSQDPLQQVIPKPETQMPTLHTRTVDMMLAPPRNQQAMLGPAPVQSGVSGMDDVQQTSSAKTAIQRIDHPAIVGSLNRAVHNNITDLTGQALHSMAESSSNPFGKTSATPSEHKNAIPLPAASSSAQSDQIARHMAQPSEFSIATTDKSAWEKPGYRTKENRRYSEQTNVPIAKSSAILPTKNLFLTTNPIAQFQAQPTVIKAAAADSISTPTSDPLISSPLNQSITPIRTELPIHVARQLAEVIQQMPTRPVDITLSPEELGRVRLSVSTSESGITVNVLAERPETLDLLRRHIDQLSQEFQALGYKDIAFSFAGAGRNSADGDGDGQPENQNKTTASNTDNGDASATQIRLSTGATAGLDLRL